MQPGTLKATKSHRWFIDEYGAAQVSMNITGLDHPTLHVALTKSAAQPANAVTGDGTGSWASSRTHSH